MDEEHLEQFAYDVLFGRCSETLEYVLQDWSDVNAPKFRVYISSGCGMAPVHHDKRLFPIVTTANREGLSEQLHTKPTEWQPPFRFRLRVTPQECTPRDSKPPEVFPHPVINKRLPFIPQRLLFLPAEELSWVLPGTHITLGVTAIKPVSGPFQKGSIQIVLRSERFGP